LRHDEKWNKIGMVVVGFGLENMTNQGDRPGDIVVLDVAMNCVAWGVLYL
jgi:hypothetical protein